MSNLALLLVCVCLSSYLPPGVESLTTADNPGIRTVFTSKALDYINKVGIPYLESQLSSISIPDLSGSSDVVIGSISYKLSNIHINSLTIPTSTLTTSAGNGLTLQSSGMSVQISADWSYKLHSLIPVKDHGTVDMSGSDISLSVSVKVGMDSTGHFDLSTTNCNFHVDDVDVTLHGGASWLYNLFNDDIADMIKKSLNGQACDGVTKAINNAGSTALESLPLSVNIDGISRINYALIEPPTFTSSYVQTDIKGEIQSVSQPVDFPFKPSPLPPVTSVNSDKMAYVWLTDYVANTAATVYEKAGLLSFTITDDMIPPKSLFHLNSQSLSLFIPGLQKKYPNMTLKVIAHVVKPPFINVKPQGANLTLPAQVDVYVLDNSTKSSPLAFSLGVMGNLVCAPYLTSENGKQYIKGKALALNAQLSVMRTNVGTIDVGDIQKAFDELGKSVFIPQVNKLGQNGLLLPVVDGLSLSNPNVTLGEGYILIASDFEYKPNFF